MGWSARAPQLAGLEPAAQTRLDALTPLKMPRGAVLFRPGDAAEGFVIMLSGRVEVFLTGPAGRDILLYAVAPGQSCVQSTLGLMGGTDYTGEAVAAEDCELVLVPRGLFLALADESPGFRHMVFATFAARLQMMMHLLERVAFQRIESRLAAALLALAPDGAPIGITHQDLATRVGTAREVVSRRLADLARRGLVATDRGQIRLTDRDALARLATLDEPPG